MSHRLGLDSAPTQILTCSKEIVGALIPPSELVKIDPALDGICRRALAHDPAKRHQSAGALVRELEDWLKKNSTSTGSVRLKLPE